MENVNVTIQHGEVIAIVGDRGSGKTLLAVSLAHQNATLGQNIFSNIEMYDIPYRKVKFADIASFPDWLHDGIIIMDEMQVGADAYNFLSSSVKNLTEFITQIRKRNVTFIYITQIFTQVTKRLRLQTNYYIEVHRISKDLDGVAHYEVFDLMNGYKKVNENVFDGRPYFPFYNTKQIISH